MAMPLNSPNNQWQSGHQDTLYICTYITNVTQSQRHKTQTLGLMVGPSHSHQQTTLHKAFFSMKLWPAAASSTSSSMKIKALIHSLIVSHVCRVIRALSKAKAILIQILKENQPIQQLMYPQKSKYKNNKKIFFGSFRLHYNWCSSSSHVMPVPAPVMDEFLYYDSTWNSIISSADDQEGGSSPSQLSGYLQWLEEKVQDSTNSEQEKNEIDKLADMFIANCHEKFRLEKVESYRRFQEMLARSM